VRRVRRLALGVAVGAGWLVVGIATVLTIGGLAVQTVAWGVALLPQAIVRLALMAQGGADWWSIAARAGEAAAGAVLSSRAIWWLIGLELLAVAGLVGLRAMLRDQTQRHDVEEGDR
jgi:hypothetical protein